jgi:hypothetical protein
VSGFNSMPKDQEIGALYLSRRSNKTLKRDTIPLKPSDQPTSKKEI